MSEFDVVEVWELVAKHELSRERRSEFEDHPDYIYLALLDRDVLHESALKAMSANPNGHLLQAEWRRHAREIRSREEAAAAGIRAAEAADERRRDVERINEEHEKSVQQRRKELQQDRQWAYKNRRESEEIKRDEQRRAKAAIEFERREIELDKLAESLEPHRAREGRERRDKEQAARLRIDRMMRKRARQVATDQRVPESERAAWLEVYSKGIADAHKHGVSEEDQATWLLTYTTSEIAARERSRQERQADAARREAILGPVERRKRFTWPVEED